MAPKPTGRPTGKAGRKGSGTRAIRVKLDRATVDKLITDSEELRAEIRSQARRLARAANATLKRKQKGYPDYGYVSARKGSKPWAKVYTRSNHAKNSNAKHQTLAKLL